MTGLRRGVREMSERKKDWIFTGSVELSGVTFFINDCTEDEARDRAQAGKYDDYDTSGAETVDWNIKAKTIEANE
jgi:hypothetical protein